MSVTGEQGCRNCAAPLAGDQRYCLNCGSRSGEPRLDFRQYSAARTEPAVQPEPSQPSPELRPQRDYTPLAAAGGIAVLGLMLLVGVLIGRGNGEQAVAPPPQIVGVGGEEGGGTASGGGGLAAAAGAPEKARGKNGGKAAKTATKAPPPEITADDSELEALEGKSGKEYSEAAAKLPDEIATPGAPPPVDNGKPGGGSSGTTIE